MNPPDAMQRALSIGAKAWPHCHPNPAVGAVIWHQDRVIGEGWTQSPGHAHAEIMALQSITAEDQHLISSSQIAVTLEPCSHHGKTPPCADALIHAGISKVFVGMKDPNPLVAGQGIQRLKNAGIATDVGLLEDACQHAHRRFITSITKQRPYIVLKWAESQDGFIDRNRSPHESAERITDAWTQSLVHHWRSQEAGLLIGANTLLSDRPQLTVRAVEGRQPQVIIWSNRPGEIEVPATWMHWATSEKANDVEALKEHLKQSNLRSILVEGGRQTLQTFLDHGLWDEVRQCVGPKLLQAGVPAPLLPRTATLHDTLSTGSDLCHLHRP